MRLRRGITCLIGCAALLYLGYAALLYRNHAHFIYPFLPNQLKISGFESTRVLVPGARSLPVQVSVGDAGAPTVLFFMGNLGSLEVFGAMLKHHQSKGRTVVAMPYRGGGGVPGSSSEETLKRDALAVFDTLPELTSGGPVIMHGHSLGTGLVMYLAANRSVDGILLSAPFYRMCEVMAKATHLPACEMPGVQRWDSAVFADAVTAPALILHGELDKLIPIDHGQRLARSMPTADFYAIEGAAHTDLFKTPPYLDLIDQFVDVVASP